MWHQLDRQPLGKHACPAANNPGRSGGGRFWEDPLIPTTSFANQQIVGSSPTAGSKILKKNRAALRHDRVPPRCRTSFTCSLPGHYAVWVAAPSRVPRVRSPGVSAVRRRDYVLHDGAGDRRGARVGEQVARASGKLDPGFQDIGERALKCVYGNHGRGAGLRVFAPLISRGPRPPGHQAKSVAPPNLPSPQTPAPDAQFAMRAAA